MRLESTTMGQRFHHACIATLLVCTGLAPMFVRAQAHAYRLDPVHTRVLLAVEHAGYSMALGTVSGSTGVLWFNPDDWSDARLDVEVPLARLDFGDEAWNKATLARNLLDAQRHANARFVARHSQARGRERARVCGDLTLRGHTGPFCMDVTFNQLRRHPLPPFRHTIGFSARGELSRSAFGIRAWPGLVGDTVALRIEVEAVRDNATGADSEATRDAASSDDGDALQRAADALLDPPPETPSDDPQEHR